MKVTHPPLILSLQHGSLEALPRHYGRRFNGPTLPVIKKILMTFNTSLLWFDSRAALEDAQRQTGWPEGGEEKNSLEMPYLANHSAHGHKPGIVPANYHGPKVAYYVYWCVWVDRLSADLQLRRGDYSLMREHALSGAGFDGPVLKKVIKVSWEWGQYHLFFDSYRAAREAERQTGWELQPYEHGFSLSVPLKGEKFISYHVDDSGSRRTAHFAAMELIPQSM